MPAPNSPQSSRTPRVRRSNAVRRHQEQRRRENDRTDPAHGEPPLDLHTPLPVISPSEVGSAATLSTLARHRMTRQRDHDPLGMTVQQAMDQLGAQNDTLNATLQEPLPVVHDDDGQPRRKRRKRDHDPLSNRDIPQYGYYGRVVPGQLQMEISSCDGGTFRDAERHDHKVENILTDDRSTYCSTKPKCNIVLKHRGGTPFSLTSITIKHPRDGFTSGLQEGLVFVAMNADDLQFRTERYDLVKDDDASPSASAAGDSLADSRREQREAVRLGELLGPLHTPPPYMAQDLLVNGRYARYRAVSGIDDITDLPNPFPAARAVRTASTDDIQARLAELVRVNSALLHRNSWQQMESSGGPVHVSTATQTTSPPPDRPVSPSSPFTPPFQGFTVTVADDRPGVSRDGVVGSANMRNQIDQRIRASGMNADGTSSRRRRVALRTDSDGYDNLGASMDPLLADEAESGHAAWLGSDEEEEGTRWPPQMPGTLPSMRMEPDDEHPMYDSGRHIRRPAARAAPRSSVARKVEWVPNKIKRPDLEKGATGDQILRPHAHFFIKKSRDSVTLEFSPAV